MSEGGLLPPVILELKAKVSELKAGLSEAREEVTKTAEHTEAGGSRMGGAFNKAAGMGKAMAVGLAGVAVTVGGFAIEAATAGEKVDAQLSTAVKNAGGNMEELDPKISKVDATLRGFGFTNDETNAALTRLTVATKDPAKALNAVSVAADLARSRNIPLATATDLVAKAMAGQTGALTRMGINLPIAAGGAQKLLSAQQSLQKAQQKVNDILAKTPDAANKSSKAHAAYEKATQAVTDAQKKLSDVQNAGGDVLNALESRVKGAASAYGDTLAGKMAAARAQVENIGESLGKRLIPVIDDALSVASKFVNWLSGHTPVLYTLAAVVGTVVVGAIGAYIAKLMMAGAQSVAQFAKMVASGAAWAANTAVQTAQATASFAAWAAKGIAQAVTAAATGFASMAASAGSWIATQAVQLAQSAAGFLVWAGEHAVMAASFIAENVAMAASATAAFIAENAATLGIGVAIAAVIAAVVWLATHWKQAWDAICTAAKWAYDNVIKPVGQWIEDNVLEPIGAAIGFLFSVWKAEWDAIAAAAKWAYDNVILPVGRWISDNVLHPIQDGVTFLQVAWGIAWRDVGNAMQWVHQNVIAPVGNAIHGALTAVGSAISWLGGIWDGIWNGIKSAVSAVWNFIKPIFDAIGGAIHAVTSGISAVGSGIGKVASFLGFDNGGVVPGPVGAPRLAVVHGGEYVLSNDMLAGRQEPSGLEDVQSAHGYTSMSQAALSGAGPATTQAAPVAGGGPQVTVITTTSADPHQIAADVGWTLRAMA